MDFEISRDRQFAEKVTDMVGLYMAPPNNAVVLSVDENSHDLALIQRADRILVTRYGRIAIGAGTRTHR